MPHPFRAAPLFAALLLAACSVGEEPFDNGMATESAPDRMEKNASVAALVPVRFHGEWNTDLSACGTDLSDTRLRVDAARLIFYENTGMVRQVEIESDRVVDVTAEYRGEGQSWRNERRLSLSEDGDTLTVSGDGSTLVRSRCP